VKSGLVANNNRENPMNRKAFIAAALACFALAGCSWLQHTFGARTSGTCKEKLCKVEVYVKGGVISVDIDELIVVRGNHDVVIEWHLKSPDYEFRDDGITPKDPKGAAGQFSKPMAADRGKVFRLGDANTAEGKHPYNIKVYDKSGKPVSLDPVIVNQG
jgi:hypothetical protein